ncbi:hypothetical protein GC102_10780 [Paenibacillus sp. LMG 31460]|uniref:Uncharacterized protein n=1 Tax=Paenibacillus germinis TaxID=2654979 RepID=A0ABX1Z1V9_9BACL|nr:hypothetical protein [Paenibacillus germinis]NOU86256.1 hypothetical protein [Paenibacillus germinis]
MRKKLLYSSMILLIVTSIVFIFWTKSKDSKFVVPVINSFYSIFIDKDYSKMYKYADFNKYSQNPNLSNEGKANVAHGLLDNDRHWYGEIKRHSIKSINWRGINKRSATVAVIALDGYGNEQTYYDEVIIKKKDEGWFITEYKSGSPWRSMKMP